MITWKPVSEKPTGAERRVLLWVVYPEVGWRCPPGPVTGWWKHGPGCFAFNEFENADHLVTHWSEVNEPVTPSSDKQKRDAAVDALLGHDQQGGLQMRRRRRQGHDATPSLPSQAMSKQYFTYILQCADGSLYTGFSIDPVKRQDTHNAGRGAKYTRSRLPVKLVWVSIPFPDPGTALCYERSIKAKTRKQKIAFIKDRPEPITGAVNYSFNLVA